MSTDININAARRLFDEVISRGQVDAADGLIAPDCVDHNPSPGQRQGRSGILEFFGQIRSAFPDWRVQIEDLVAQGDRVVARLTADVTHGGVFFGIAPTGRRVHVRVIDILRFENGRIVERWGERNDLESCSSCSRPP